LISFPITGSLVDFDLWDDIKTLKDIPILLTSGEYDIVRPVTVNALYKALPLSEKVLFPGSGHASIFDVTAQLLDTVNGFLERVGFSETDQKIVFIPKRSGETKMTIPRTFLRYM
jgi:pimeloyl-ACP methyl ester carboxylesterase